MAPVSDPDPDPDPLQAQPVGHRAQTERGTQVSGHTSLVAATATPPVRYHRLMTITTTTAGHGFREELAAAAALFHGLSDPTRLAIVRRLSAGEARIVDLTDQFGLAQSTVSAHVACLRDCGLVAGRAQGRQMFYSLTRPEQPQRPAPAEALLAAAGDGVVLCPNYGDRAGGMSSGLGDV